MINDYIQTHKNDIDFIIQILLNESKQKNENDKYELEINSDIEEILSTNINECFTNDKFIELPIATIYRIIKQSSSNILNCDKLLDFINKRLSKLHVLFEFIRLRDLSEDRLFHLSELYSESDEQTRGFFSYMKCDIIFLTEMCKKNKCLEELLNKSKIENEQQQTKISKLELQTQEKDRIKEEQIIQIKEFEEKIRKLEMQLADSEKIIIQNDEEKNQLEKQLADSEKMTVELKKRLDEENSPIKGQIKAIVKRGLLINAKINLKAASGSSLDTSKSKYIISTNGEKSLGFDAYENGQPITSLQMNTDYFICKSGTYYFRCIVFDNQGKSREIVSNSVATSGTNVEFNYSGKCETVSLPPG